MTGSPETLLKERVPFIDLRAPVEFARGAVPGAVNLPLLSDAERAEVGLAYKQSGQRAAIDRGNELVSGATKLERVEAWTRFVDENPNAWLYCWRGGLRSQIATEWLGEVGYQVPRVTGGYKALRQACLDVLTAAAQSALPWLVLAGRTGTGKTVVIGCLDNAIDLEGLANHRGSAFGRQTTEQPTPVDFENTLAAAFLNHQSNTLVLEDESRTIGRLALPEAWHARMQRAPLALLEASFDSRVAHIKEEYVDQPLAAGEDPSALSTRLAEALDKIRTRLGGERHALVRRALQDGFVHGDHGRWIGMLLEWYYDPMYDYQLESKRSRICFHGDRAAVTDYLESQ